MLVFTLLNILFLSTMYKIVVLAAVLVTHSVASPFESGRVVNGTNAKSGEIPYIVSLRKNNKHNCGASIIDEMHVLTAAHCVEGESVNILSIQYGVTHISASGNLIKVSKVDIHEDYVAGPRSPNDIAVLTLESALVYNKSVDMHEDHVRSGTYKNDIAILTFESALVYDKFVQPVVLPEQDEAPPAGDTSILAGWGKPHTGGEIMQDLQRVELLVYSDKDCKAAHHTWPYIVNAKYHLCSGVPAGGKGQCNHDSGGPLVSNGKQIGIVSWSKKPCTIKGYPGVYCRVSRYINWIKKKIQ